MKDFFKMTLATIVGFFVVSVISTIFSVIVFMSIIISSTNNTTVKIDNNSIMKIDLSGVIVERSKSEDYMAIMGVISDKNSFIGLDDLREAFKKAAQDERIKAVYLECGALSATPAQVEDIRDMIISFQKTGKQVYAYADQYTQGAYWAVSSADEKWLNPYGQVAILGFSSQSMFMKRALDKIGVEMQIFKVGTFKSAVEPYLLTEMSDANRAQMQQFNDVIWAKMKHDIGNPNIQEFADKGLFFADTKETLNYELVDTLVYKSDVMTLLENKLSKGVSFISYKNVNKSITIPSTSTHQIAIIYAEGAIDDGTSDGIKSEDIVRELEKLREDDKIKAVVLRVHSPGGSAFGSENMWYSANKLRKEKPLIVSMSGYAASGGYYMSCMADTIVAQHTTLTGSIGIFGMFPNVEGLTNKIGVDFDVVKTAKYADFGSITRPMNNGEKAILQNYIERGYDLFVDRCAEGREIDVDKLKTMAEGRVWTGYDAKELGLIDEIGGLDRAVEIAAEKAGLANYKVVEYPKKKDLVTQIMEDVVGSAKNMILAKKLGVAYQHVSLYDRMINMIGIQAFMPYIITL